MSASSIETQLIEKLNAQLASGEIDSTVDLMVKHDDGTTEAVRKTVTDGAEYLEALVSQYQVTMPYLARNALVSLIAKDHKVIVEMAASELTEVSLGDIKLKDTNLLTRGVVLHASVFNTITKTGKKAGSPLKIGSLFLADATKRIMVVKVFYDTPWEWLFNAIDDGSILRRTIVVSGARCAEDQYSPFKYSLSLNPGGTIIYAESPMPVPDVSVPIKQITELSGVVSCQGRLIKINPVTTKNRKDGTAFWVRTVEIVDTDGTSIHVKLWDDAAKLDFPDKGILKIICAKVSPDEYAKEKGYKRAFVIEVDTASQVELITEGGDSVPAYPEARGKASSAVTAQQLAEPKIGESIQTIVTLFHIRSQKFAAEPEGSPRKGKWLPSPPFYVACQRTIKDSDRICNKGVKDQAGVPTCPRCGPVTAAETKEKIQLTATITDFSASVDIKLFDRSVEAVFGQTEDDLLAEYHRMNPDQFFMLKNEAVAGKLFTVTGSYQLSDYGLQFNLASIAPIELTEAVATEREVITS